MQEMPKMLATSYVSNAVGLDTYGGMAKKFASSDLIKQLSQINHQTNPIDKKDQQMANTTRIVRIYIADTDENVPLEKRLMFSGDEKLTDATDQELFFDVPIAQILADHNSFRLSITDKAQSEKFGRDVKLEPIRIRDLKMTVVTIASF